MAPILIGPPGGCEARSKRACKSYSRLTEIFIYRESAITLELLEINTAQTEREKLSVGRTSWSQVGYTRLQAAFFPALDQGQSCTLRHSPAFAGLFSMYR